MPVVTPDEMRAIDAAAPEPVDQLIERAGSAVARTALDMLGGAYGRTVVVIAGSGNDGADGRSAARRLERRGVRCRIVAATDVPDALDTCDLVIDAAFGTGFRGEWTAPDPGDALVLAVDIPSGIDALTGQSSGRPLRADRTITFQAMKPGHLLGSGPELSGRIDVADIGLDVSSARQQLVTADDVARWWPRRPTDAHKWRGAVKVVAGSPEMPGAAALAAAAAARAGAGLVSLSVPGSDDSARRLDLPAEIVQRFVPSTGFADVALADIDRFGALVVGPGLGRAPTVLEAARQCISSAGVPVVVDGDGLTALADAPDSASTILRRRGAATVLTPHDGEFDTLTGRRPAADRVADVRTAAAALHATVLLKGPTTIVATPAGDVLHVDHGDERLATAGTGDVLAGVVAALLARGLTAERSAAVAAWVHADAARRRTRFGLVAGDIVDELPSTIDAVVGEP